MLKPPEALSTVENALRLVVDVVLGDAWESMIPEPKLDLAKSRMAAEVRKRDGLMATGSLIRYLDFSMLTQLVVDQWLAFEPVFVDQRRTELYFDFLKTVRNAEAHNRPLLGYEQELLSGIAGHLRNQVSLFQTSRYSANKQDLLLARIIDPFGHEGIVQDDDVRVVLHAGQHIQLNCELLEPSLAPVTWLVDVDLYQVGGPVMGASVTLDLIIADTHRGQSYLVNVYMIGHGSRHRHQGTIWDESGELKFGYDDVRYFTYEIDARE